MVRYGHTYTFDAAKDSITEAQQRIFVIRRISGHLRRDGDLWTFIYLNDPNFNLNAAQYSTDIPGNVQPPVECWLTELLSDNASPKFLQDLGSDGYGFVVMVLREIKTTWKLLLYEMERFLERMVRSLDLYYELC